MQNKIKNILCVLLFCFFSSASAAPLTLHVLNVGQGDSILVQFPTGENMLVDSGPGSASDAVIQCLREQGIRKIDILVGTIHPHEDHTRELCGRPARVSGG